MNEVFEELALTIRAHYPYIYFLSYEEDRALHGIRQLAKEMERSLWSWSAIDGLRGPDKKSIEMSADPLRALAHLDKLKGPGLLVLKDFHRHIEDIGVVRRMRDMRSRLSRRQWSVVLLSPRAVIPSDLEKEVIILELPLPGLQEVARILHRLLKGEKITIDVELFERFVKASLGLTEDEIKRVYSKVLLRGGCFGDDQLREVIAEKRQIIDRSEFLEFHDLSTEISEVGGLDNLKQWLESRAMAFSEKARTYGLPEPKGLFLLGVQGCGKSLTAKAIADLWKVPLLRLDAGALVMRAGSAEEDFRRTIAIAESMAPVVLWIDEIEKAFSGMDGSDSVNASAVRVFGNFITWLQEKEAPVFVVATANDVRNLPPEMLRKGRFDEIFWIDLPNIHERERIFGIHLSKRGRDPVDFHTWQLAENTDRFSGAEIEQAVVDALFDSFAEDRELETADILRAIRRTVPLALTMDQAIKRLKDWARDRTRPATFDSRRIDFFRHWEAEPEGEIDPLS
ncbi:MAG: AAA family ATPase [Myxococcota bacterium]|nr:AAA family ATPase [Myxococcota bacterium]